MAPPGSGKGDQHQECAGDKPNRHSPRPGALRVHGGEQQRPEKQGATGESEATQAPDAQKVFRPYAEKGPEQDGCSGVGVGSAAVGVDPEEENADPERERHHHSYLHVSFSGPLAQRADSQRCSQSERGHPKHRCNPEEGRSGRPGKADVQQGFRGKRLRTKDDEVAHK